MKTSTQIRADRWLWRPMAALANLVAARRQSPPPSEVKCIAVCKFKGMGSIVQATPLLQALRSLHPQARIIFVTTAGNRAVLRLIPQVDEVLCVEESGWQDLMRSLRGVRLRLRAMRPEVFINLEIHSHYSHVFAWRSGAPVRLGFLLPGASPVRGLYTTQLPFDPDAPMSAMYHMFAQWLGQEAPEAGLHKLCTEAVEGPMAAGRPLYVLNPNASDGRLERRWPAAHFAELARLLLAQSPDAAVVFTGSKAERAYVQSIVEQVQGGRQVHNTAGELTLEGLLGLLCRADVLVTNDTGPMHLAFAAGVRTVALFGPVAPWKYHLPPHVVALYHAAHCSPCLHHRLLPTCGGDNICMKGIKVEEVLGAVNSCLQNTTPTI